MIVSPADVRRGDQKRNRVQPDVFVVRLVDGKRPTYPYALADLLLTWAVGPLSPLDDTEEEALRQERLSRTLKPSPVAFRGRLQSWVRSIR